MQRKIERGPKMLALVRDNKGPYKLIDAIYLTILSRYPATEEKALAVEHIVKSANRKEGAFDIAWEANNSSEFLYRH